MSTPTPATGFVLAGGQSRRMGSDKALLNWHGRSLLAHMTMLLEAVCSSVTVVGRDSLPDDTPGLGPIGGIATALRVSSTELNLVLAVDLPDLTPDCLKYFKERCESSTRPLTVCKIESVTPLCLGITLDARTVVSGYILDGQLSLRGLIERLEPEVIDVRDLREAGFTESMFTNINSIDDYRAAVSRVLTD